MRKLTRRESLGRLAAGTAGLLGCAAGRAPDAEKPPLLLTREGGDRATGYVMSNKIARRGEHLVCTWLDAQRQNRWALVDPARGAILRTGAVGAPGVDNHCGAALAVGADGALDLLVGAHHGAFGHYRLTPGEQDWTPVEDGRAVGKSATYPSLVCDGSGTLHVVYRRENRGRDAQLHYCRRPRNGPWSPPRVLACAAVSEHSWLTGAIEAAESGRLHVVISNTLPAAERGANARYYGASHLYSDDSGATWRQFGAAEPVPAAAEGARLRRIEGPGMPAERIEAEYRYGTPLALSSYYHKMVLSNPIVDRAGRPWVILHNLLTGDAELSRHEEQGAWVGTPLRPLVQALLPGYRIQHCGQLARHPDGSIEAVLMVSRAGEIAWGSPSTTLARLRFDPAGKALATNVVCPPDSSIPCWLPSLERWSPRAPGARPALLYTRGVNAGGGRQNVNSVTTEVWLAFG